MVIGIDNVVVIGCSDVGFIDIGDMVVFNCDWVGKRFVVGIVENMGIFYDSLYEIVFVYVWVIVIFGCRIYLIKYLFFC